MRAELVEINGYRTRVVDDGAGAAVVLVHGTPLDLTFWDPLVAALGPVRTVRYDVRGHGSARGVAVPGPEVLADDLVALLDRLRLPDAHLVGHSWGGQIVQRAVLDRPDRVRRVSLLCTRASPFPPFTAAAAALRSGTADREASLARWFTPDELGRDDPLAVAVRAQVREADLAAWTDALDAIAAFDVLADLPAVTVPVDVVAAEHDGVAAPDHMARVAGALPRGALHVLGGARHLAPLQHPAGIARLLGRPGPGRPAG